MAALSRGYKPKIATLHSSLENNTGDHNNLYKKPLLMYSGF